MFKRLSRETPLHVMLIPSFLLVLIYHYIPMFGIVIAFQRFNPIKGFWHSEWVGLDNFTYSLALPDTKQAILNTLFIGFMKITANLLVPLIVSLLLNEVQKTFIKRGVQTFIYLPHFLSWVILSGILIDILSPSSGSVNQFLNLFGIKSIFFLGSNHWFPFVLISSDVWKEFGFSTIVYLAALTSINPSLYEAAYVDGANRWKQTIHITLPGILPIIILMATLSLGNVLNGGFDQVFNLYNPTVYHSGDILDTLIYRIGFLNTDYSVATALGVFKSVVSFAMISTSYWVAYRFANYRIF